MNEKLLDIQRLDKHFNSFKRKLDNFVPSKRKINFTMSNANYGSSLRFSNSGQRNKSLIVFNGGYENVEVYQMMVDKLRHYQQQYSIALNFLHDELNEITVREKKARKILEMQDEISSTDYIYIKKLEQSIDDAQKSLPDNNRELENIIQNELNAVREIEKSNKTRIKAQTRPKEFKSRSSDVFGLSQIFSSQNVFLEQSKSEVIFTSTHSYEIESVQSNIENLCTVVRKKNKERIHQERLLEELIHSYHEQRESLQEQFNEKQQYITSLQKHLDKRYYLYDHIQILQEKVLKDSAKYNRLCREREQIERQNFTVTRDKHNAGLAVQQLMKDKTKIQHRIEEYEQRKMIISKHKKNLTQTKLKMESWENEISLLEKRVYAMETRLEKSGIDFENKIDESQQELDRLDMLAMRMSGSSNKSSRLEEELVSIILNE